MMLFFLISVYVSRKLETGVNKALLALPVIFGKSISHPNLFFQVKSKKIY